MEVPSQMAPLPPDRDRVTEGTGLTLTVTEEAPVMTPGTPFAVTPVSVQTVVAEGLTVILYDDVLIAGVVCGTAPTV